MNDYRASLGIDPVDQYEKAKKDLLQAYSSFQKLSQLEQRKLVGELFGVAQVDMICNAFRQIFNA